MKRRHIAQRLSDECGLLVGHADKVVGSLTEIIVQEIIKGELELPGVGKFGGALDQANDWPQPPEAQD